MRVLVVEDEARIRDSLCDALGRAGYVAESVSDGEQAWFQGGTGNYGAIVLDLGLPRLDGLTVLKRWRQEGLTTPILILTARGSWAERVEGIDSGADDYLPKPFRMEELLARLRALLRRSAGQVQPVITHGDLTLDPRLRVVTRAGAPLNLTPLEFRLLSALLHHRGEALSQMELAEHLYAHDHDRDANAIEALVTRLRRKVGPGVIATRRGFGYTITGPA